MFDFIFYFFLQINFRTIYAASISGYQNVWSFVLGSSIMQERYQMCYGICDQYYCRLVQITCINKIIQSVLKCVSQMPLMVIGANSFNMWNIGDD